MKKFGLEEKDFLLLKDLVLKPLKDMGAKTFVFGSRARGDYKAFSDIDILFEFSNDKAKEAAKLYLLKSAIEESHFPYKVDFVEMKELAPSYKEQILKEKIEV